MSSVTGQQLVQHFRENAELARQLAHTYAQLAHTLQQALEALEPQQVQAAKDLAEAYLPELSETALGDLALRAGFKKLQRRSPLQAMAHEAEVLTRRIATIQADERYQRRQWLVGPHGELTGLLAERVSMLEPWEEACAVYEQHTHFLTLIELGYDTPDYSVSFLEARYWTFWAAGDRICRELGLDDFGDDVLPAYTKVEAERARWREQVAEVQARIDEVHDLVRLHDRAVARIPRLPEIYLAKSREAVAEFLGLADAQLLAQWNDEHDQPDRAVTMGLRRLAGLRAKAEALEDLLHKGVQPFLEDMRRRQAKYERKISKFARSKNLYARHPTAYRDDKFATKRGKYQERAEQAHKLAQRMLAYDDYARFDVARNAPELWFREMTGSKPSRLFPGHRSWYERQPGVKPVRSRPDDADERVAAAAVVASVRDDLGYVS